jgi:hypothetical protein
METYAMESALLRSRKCSGAADMTAVFLRDAMGRIELSGRTVLANAGDAAAMNTLRRLAAYEPVNSIELRRKIAARLLESQRYVVG